jgi:hypothetical protein
MITSLLIRNVGAGLNSFKFFSAEYEYWQFLRREKLPHNFVF